MNKKFWASIILVSLATAGLISCVALAASPTSDALTGQVLMHDHAPIVTSGNNVGIGSSNPRGALDVNGTIYTSSSGVSSISSGLIVDGSIYTTQAGTQSGLYTQNGTPVILNTVSDGATIGTNIVLTNNNFAADLTGWTIGGTGSGWSWSSGALHAAGNTDTLSQSVSTTSGTVYHIGIPISGRTAGTISVTVGSVTIYLSGGTTTFTSTVSSAFIAASTGTVSLTITPSTDFDGKITSVTIDEITRYSDTPAAQIYTSGLTLNYPIDIRHGGGNGTDLSIGYRALSSLYPPSLYNNTAVGYNALKELTNAANVTAFGSEAGNQKIIGNNGVYIGGYAGGNDLTGTNIIAIGPSAYYSAGVASTAYDSIFIGGSAAVKVASGSANVTVGTNTINAATSSSNNTLVGSNVMRYSIGDSNTAIGTSALQGSAGASTPDYSVAVGRGALSGITTGDYNISIGYNAGNNITTGGTNMMLGRSVSALDPTASGQLSIMNIIFGTGNTNTGTTISTGNIGIGTNAPKYKLEVDGIIYGTITPKNTAAATIAVDGSIYFNSSTKHWLGWDGSSWKQLDN